MEESKTSGGPERPPSRWWRFAERLKLLLEIAAIITAGAWAYTRFTNDDEPTLADRVNVIGKLSWEKVTPQQCQAEYEVQFQNIGRLPVRVAEVRLSVWYMSESPGVSDQVRVEYVDPMALRMKPAIYSMATERIKGNFRPSESDTEGFSFLIRNTPGKRILFQIELWSEEDAKKKPRLVDATWGDIRWDTVCGDQPQPAKLER